MTVGLYPSLESCNVLPSLAREIISKTMGSSRGKTFGTPRRAETSPFTTSLWQEQSFQCQCVLLGTGRTTAEPERVERKRNKTKLLFNPILMVVVCLSCTGHRRPWDSVNP